MPREASSAPRARAAAPYAGRAPWLEPQNTVTRSIRRSGDVVALVLDRRLEGADRDGRRVVVHVDRPVRHGDLDPDHARDGPDGRLDGVLAVVARDARHPDDDRGHA